MAKYKGKRIIVDGKEYCLGDQIGSGRNGLVFAASTGSSFEYAVKFLNIKETDPEFSEKKQRFLSELQFCENSDHPYVLKAVGHGEYNGLLLYVMPRYDQTLRNVIDQNHDYVHLLEYCVQLCEAVKYVHDKGVIHRDIKPENIFVSNDGNLVLADFGIAHFCESILTESGDFLGNRGYAAPEQLIKRNAHHITKACDIYAIGAVMNELFTKQKPAGSQYALIADSIPLLSQCDMLLHRCMRQNPLERPDIDEVLAEIKLIRGDILQDIDWILDSAMGETELLESEANRVLDMAGKDIVTAKHIFYNTAADALERIDCCYHKSIRYDLSEYLQSLYFHRCLYRICYDKFNYESHAYATGHRYDSLDLDNPDDMKHLQQFEECIGAYTSADQYLVNLRGSALKLFCSCCDYHCEEIIRKVKRLKDFVAGLSSSPIMYIVYQLRQVLTEDDVQEFDFIDHISIDWSTSTYDADSIDNLFISDDNSELYKVLSTFEHKWNIIWSKVNAKEYSVKFRNREDYNQFKKYALELAKPHYVFEGDVLGIIRINREWDGIVELENFDSFDILNVLSKILGLRAIEE